MDERAVWIAGSGVVVTTCGTNAVAWAVGTSATGSSLPWWPVGVFGGAALVAGWLVTAALLRTWPLHRLAIAPAEALDDCIRRGREARARITYDELGEWGNAHVASEWSLYTANRLHRHFPAIADEFQLASGDEAHFSGQALFINTVNAKLAVLTSARREL